MRMLLNVRWIAMRCFSRGTRYSRKSRVTQSCASGVRLPPTAYESVTVLLLPPAAHHKEKNRNAVPVYLHGAARAALRHTRDLQPSLERPRRTGARHAREHPRQLARRELRSGSARLLDQGAR